MYDLKTFLVDLKSAFKRIPLIYRWGIVIAQVIVGFQAFMICALAFTLPLPETLMYSLILPGIVIWALVLWNKWERSD